MAAKILRSHNFFKHPRGVVYSVLRKSKVCLKSLYITVLELNNIFHLISRAVTFSTIPMTRSKLNDVDIIRCYLYTFSMICHGGVVVTQFPPISEVGSSNPKPYVGQLVVAYRWSAIYSTQP